MKSAMDGVPCESKWVQENIHKFLCEQFQHVGITDTNKNIKNNRYQNLGGSFASFMGGYLFDPRLLNLEGVSHNL